MTDAVDMVKPTIQNPVTDDSYNEFQRYRKTVDEKKKKIIIVYRVS